MADLPHLRISGSERSYDYTARGGGGSGEFQRPVRDRVQHAQKLKQELADVDQAANQQGFAADDPHPVTYELHPDAIEVVESLERRQSGIELLSVVKRSNHIVATVLIPPGKRRIVEAIFHRYETKDTPAGQPECEKLVASIESLRLATEQDLWTDTIAFPAAGDPIWWEVWLHHDPATDAVNTQRAFTQLAEAAGLRVNPRRITFPDRVVLLVHGSFEAWQTQPRLLLFVAELRKAKELAGAYVEVEPRFQQEIAEDLLERIQRPTVDATAVCLLDTGVDRNHPLLEYALSQQDAQAMDPTWGVNDHDPERHGTGMAGIGLYGSLLDVLQTAGPVTVVHRLESVKILPPRGNNDPDLYGEITQQAIARAETTAPRRKRVGCLTVTADSRDGGLPSSWSGAIDQLCAGGPVVGDPILVCIAAGNLRDEIVSTSFNYPVLAGEKAGIEDPGQAWNAVTVGAYTDLVQIQHPDFDGYQPIAPAGDLSPTSRTSLAWREEFRKGWPVKPDIVMEGGNWARTPGSTPDTPDDLGLLTTIVHPSGRLFTITRDTSPATAAAARLAALIWTQYPNLRPETVRALLVHSAQWTAAMCERFPGRAKGDIHNRLRCYGYGVPDLQRALYSLQNRATLIYEGQLRPYKKEAGKIKTNEMHVHNLPWPQQVLESLGAEQVRIRVTLSYFVEPSPGRRGWTRRHRYASHGLRFDVKRPTETLEQLVQRLSAAGDDEDSPAAGSAAQSPPWLVGMKGRTKGSIHSDWWEGTAAELAAAGYLAVFPVTGWWRERPHLDRWNSPAPYSLIISLETDADVELYTAIQNVATVRAEIIT